MFLKEKCPLYFFAVVLVLLIFSWLFVVSYFSIALSKSFLRISKLRWLITILLFVSICALDGVIGWQLEKLIPYSFDAAGMIFSTKLESLELNYASTVFSFVTIVAMLTGTAYLLDKKVEV